jgi:hypothetical protein
MDTQTDSDGAVRTVEADFYYLAPMAEPPHSHTYDPPPGVPRTNATYEPHRLPVRNARPIAVDVSLDREGFALVRQQRGTRLLR